MNAPFVMQFPAIRGIQSTREYYVTMIPMKLIPKILFFDNENLSPELCSQRTLNKSRIPQIVDYLVNNPTEYTLSALTASIDGSIEFESLSEDPNKYNIGTIRIPMTARLIVNDGQHRLAAIQTALKKRPDLGDETVACVLFMDTGLRRAQQMFTDLNRYAIRPTQSLNILYDYRDKSAQLAKDIVKYTPIFSNLTEMDKSTISNRSTKLFTLSGIYRANRELLLDKIDEPYESQLKISLDYWNEITEHITEWKMVKKGQISSADLRRDYIHAHTVTLVALGRTGRALFMQQSNNWKEVLQRLNDIDWRRSNTKVWEGRAMIGGKVSISLNNITLLTNAVKQTLGLILTEEELKVESAFMDSRDEQEVIL